MRQWKWKQPTTTFDVITDPTDGYINVYKGKKLIYTRKNLTPKQVELIEDNFLKEVTNTGNEPTSYIQ